MARNILLSSLTARARQRWAGEGDNSIDVVELKALVSEFYAELHAAVSDKGARYFETEATLDLNNLALPGDHLSTIGVDLVLSGRAGPGRPGGGPFGPPARPCLVGHTTAGPASSRAEEVASLALYPTPTSGTY